MNHNQLRVSSEFRYLSIFSYIYATISVWLISILFSLSDYKPSHQNYDHSLENIFFVINLIWKCVNRKINHHFIDSVILKFFSLIICVGLLYYTIESIIYVPKLNWIINLFHNSYKFLSDHIVNSKTKKSDCLVTFS